MSRSRPRFVATCLLLAGIAGYSAAPAQASAPPNTWTQLTTLPEQLDSPLFALAVSPDNSSLLLAGSPAGTIYRSTDGGGTWKSVAQNLGHGVVSLGFDPFDTSTVLAGTRLGGVWRSRDAGQSWTRQRGIGDVTARAFGFAKAMRVAGTDSGIFVNRTGAGWSAAGLAGVSVAAVAVAAVNEPSKVLIGGDAAHQDGLPLYMSTDDATNWSPLRNPAAANTVVSALASGALIPGQDVRPLLMGTNSGAFLSTDNARSWSPLGLPATDFTAAAFVSGRSDHLYLASDGGASERGGLWYSSDTGSTFHDLKPPLAGVTALAISTDAKPQVYIATFRPMDHAVMLWSYKDNGGPPQRPAAGVPSPKEAVAGPALGGPAAGEPNPLSLTLAELPYALLGLGAMLILIIAVFAYVLRGRQRKF